MPELISPPPAQESGHGTKPHDLFPPSIEGRGQGVGCVGRVNGLFQTHKAPNRHPLSPFFAGGSGASGKQKHIRDGIASRMCLNTVFIFPKRLQRKPFFFKFAADVRGERLNELFVGLRLVEEAEYLLRYLACSAAGIHSAHQIDEVLLLL